MEEGERFSESEPNFIESSSGFSVRILGLTGMRYSEGRRSVWIDSEDLATGAMALFKDSIKTWEGEGGERAVSAADRDRIVANIKRAFESCGYELVVQSDFEWPFGLRDNSGS